MSRYYPITLKIEGKLCLVIGGGPVAERKVSGLLEAGAQVRLVSPTLTTALQERAAAGQVDVLLARYEAACLADASLVFAATGDRQVNAQVAADAQARGIPVNVADSPEESSFLVPSVVRRGEFCLSVSTGGNNPMLAARLCDALEKQFGPEYGDFVELLGRMRAYIKTKTTNATHRRYALARLLDAEAELCQDLRAGQSAVAQARAEALVEEALGSERADCTSFSSD